MENEEESEFFCYECGTPLDGDEINWMNDYPVCPYCESEIEL